MTGEVLDYQDLVARYETGLIDNLRGFGFQTDYLDLWVPDEDLSRSLLNLLDAAAVAGHPALAIRLPREALAVLRNPDFLGAAQSRGDLRIEESHDGVVLSARSLRLAEHAAASPSAPVQPPPQALRSSTAAQPQARQSAVKLQQPEVIHQAYAQAVADHAARGAAPAKNTPAGAVAVEASCDGLVLQAWIDPADHRIAAAYHSGCRRAVACGLLTALVELLRDLPLVEAADHGAIRLEQALRDAASSRPAAGIVIPETIDPAFALITQLLRDLLKDYRNKTGFAEIVNTFDLKPSAEWLAASDTERRTKIMKAFEKGGFSVSEIDIVAIEYDVRVVVMLSGHLAADAAKSAIVLERCLKRHLDNRLELFLTELKDGNKIRRLSEPGAQ